MNSDSLCPGLFSLIKHYPLIQNKNSKDVSFGVLKPLKWITYFWMALNIHDKIKKNPMTVGNTAPIKPRNVSVEKCVKVIFSQDKKYRTLPTCLTVVDSGVYIRSHHSMLVQKHKHVQLCGWFNQLHHFSWSLSLLSDGWMETVSWCRHPVTSAQWGWHMSLHWLLYVVKMNNMCIWILLFLYQKMMNNESHLWRQSHSSDSECAWIRV